MCVGLWCLTHQDYSLVLCTNRDEYLSRPTAPAHWHSFESLKRSITSDRKEADSPPISEHEEESVLSGTDTLAGGTWFGINKFGEVALLTNITEPVANLSSSRGHLCSSFLLRNLGAQDITLSQFIDELTASDTRYSGFNLLLLAPSYPDPSCNDTGSCPVQYDAAFLSNDGAGNPIVTVPLSGPSRACGGISNGVSSGFDPFTGHKTDSGWPKVMRGRELLSDVLAKSENEDVLVEGLFEMMRTTTHSPPRTRQAFQENILIDPIDLAHLRTGTSFAPTYHMTSAVSQSCLGSKTHEVSAKLASLRTPPSSLSSESFVCDKIQTQDERQSLLHARYYATRLTSVLLVRKDGEALFIERDVWVTGQNEHPVLAEGKAHHERRFNFRIK